MISDHFRYLRVFSVHFGTILIFFGLWVTDVNYIGLDWETFWQIPIASGWAQIHFGYQWALLLISCNFGLLRCFKFQLTNHCLESTLVISQVKSSQMLSDPFRYLRVVSVHFGTILMFFENPITANHIKLHWETSDTNSNRFGSALIHFGYRWALPVDFNDFVKFRITSVFQMFTRCFESTLVKSDDFGSLRNNSNEFRTISDCIGKLRAKTQIHFAAYLLALQVALGFFRWI